MTAKQILPETTHFKIVHLHWLPNKPYSVQPKIEKTRDSYAFIPFPPSADDVETLVPHLHEQEDFYTRNRKLVEENA